MGEQRYYELWMRKQRLVEGAADVRSELLVEELLELEGATPLCWILRVQRRPRPVLLDQGNDPGGVTGGPPVPARGLARAAAVLGEADLRLAAGLADLDPGAAAAAADELEATGILEEGRPLRFAHPIVRTAVEGDLSPGARACLHAAAARRVAREGASALLIASHLVATDAAEDDWVVDSLRAAANIADADGAPDSASITLALGRMLQIDGRNRQALEVFDRTRARLGSADRRATLVRVYRAHHR